MKITKRAGPPEDLVYFDDELDLKKDVEDVAIINTPLTDLTIGTIQLLRTV